MIHIAYGAIFGDASQLLSPKLLVLFLFTQFFNLAHASQACFSDQAGRYFSLFCYPLSTEKLLTQMSRACGSMQAEACNLHQVQSTFNFGRGFFDGSICSLGADATAKMVACELDFLSKTVPKRMYGTLDDIGISITIVVSILVAIPLLYALYKYGARPIYNDIVSHPAVARLTGRRKYKRLSAALAENDAAFVKEICQLAQANSVRLPRDVALYILQFTVGYHSAQSNEEAQQRAEGVSVIRFFDNPERIHIRRRAQNDAFHGMQYHRIELLENMDTNEAAPLLIKVQK